MTKLTRNPYVYLAIGLAVLYMFMFTHHEGRNKSQWKTKCDRQEQWERKV